MVCETLKVPQSQFIDFNSSSLLACIDNFCLPAISKIFEMLFFTFHRHIMIDGKDVQLSAAPVTSQVTSCRLSGLTGRYGTIAVFMRPSPPSTRPVT